MQNNPIAIISGREALHPSLPRAGGVGATESGGGLQGAPFSGVLKDAMSNLQGLEQQATSTVDGLVSGRGVDIHEAMIATEKSDQAFEMALAVRGKMVSAYQSMMGVQF
jgi:flagellar hook-basal body complex protein FliE